jgi:hypothetical protein
LAEVFGAAEFLGGVVGLLFVEELLAPYVNFFLSEGFKIWNEHIRVSSTVIIEPALSNSPGKNRHIN